ncbi:MAG TPA: hypothetical protein VKD66_16290 [Streptosporangiaceae bacterium]|nr:hypothetical protein [Streptosporangiaceae bacterium]
MTDVLAARPNKRWRLRTPHWIAVEQAVEHDLGQTLERLRRGDLPLGEAHTLLLAYGEHCAERAADLARSAAEQRARRRLKERGL